MHWIAFIAAVLALLLAKLLRAPVRSSRFISVLWFASAFILTSFTVRVFSEHAGITRPTAFDPFVTHAAQQAVEEPEAPLVLFVGASFSRNAIDDVALTNELRAAGYPHRVINLSLEGASLQERDAALWDFMRTSRVAPDVVFLEVADEYDRDPAYVFSVAKFSDRAIEQFDPDAVYWSMKGLAQGQCEGKVGCAKSWALLQIHAMMNWTNLGLLATGTPLEDIAPAPAFDPQDKPRDSFTLETDEITLALREPVSVQPQTGPTWARLFRLDQRRRLEMAGVRRVAYYYPPVLSRESRQYVAQLCAGELSDFPCIAPIDQRLLLGLAGNVWLDERHLLRDGAEVYTDWLAYQIDRWGALH